jgi:hypothetical protein
MLSTAVFSVTQRISQLLWNLKFHYCVHMCHILSQTNPVCNLIPYAFKIYDLPKGFFLSGILSKVLCAVLISPMLATCLLSHPRLFYHLKNIWWRSQIMKLLSVQCSSRYYFLCLEIKYFPHHHLLRQSQSISFCVLPLQCENKFYNQNIR